MVHTFHVTPRTYYLIALSFATVYATPLYKRPTASTAGIQTTIDGGVAVIDQEYR